MNVLYSLLYFSNSPLSIGKIDKPVLTQALIPECTVDALDVCVLWRPHRDGSGPRVCYSVQCPGLCR